MAPKVFFFPIVFGVRTPGNNIVDGYQLPKDIRYLLNIGTRFRLT